NFIAQVVDSASVTATARLAITVNTPSGAQFDSSFVSQSVPSFLAPGQLFSVTMTWRNTGTGQWNEGLQVRIGAQNPTNNSNWGSDRISFQQYIIPPATQFTITVQNLTAPSTAGVYNFQWQMVQDNGVGFFGDVSSNVSITVGNPAATLSIQTTSLPGAQVGQPFSQQMTAAGGTPPYKWSVAAAPLPAGLSLNSSTGVISGIPAQPGNFTFAVSVSDSGSQSTQKTIGITISPSPLAISGPTFPAGVIGAAFSQQLTAVGGVGPFAWTVSAGALPSGLSLNPASGLISGSPTSPGTFSFTVTVTDKQPISASSALQITVVSPGLVPQIALVKYKPGPRKLIIRGQNFDAAAAVSIDGSIIGSRFPVVLRDAGDIIIKPINLGSGAHQLQVVNSNGAGSNVVQFSVP
ncbi:MAG: putative Ig domain-containing protein, partial [Blastocatellia bacterium]